MLTLKDYYSDLLNSEGQQESQLIHEWPQDLRDTIVSAFVNAVSEASVKGSVCPIKPGSTNQSIGNQVENYTIEKIDTVISGFSISICPGKGYPDRMLIQDTTKLRVPLEVKATSHWNEKDSNRRVLTSSSNKLRTAFSAPIYHLLLTAIYSPDQDQDSVTINTIRLDFLEPTTTVNVRFEASVSHKILASDPYYSKMI